jgi:ribosomal protection tetracycline resistance protein
MAWVQGLKSVEPGDFIGKFNEDLCLKIDKTPALLTVQVIPENSSDINVLVDALYTLNNEDPNLNFLFLKEERELHINIKGEVQKEILQSILLQRFSIQAQFSDPTVIYKETPTKVSEGYVRYWMPKPCWAIMKFKIEPNDRGAGVEYKSIIGVNDVKQHYQNDVLKTIPEALKQGILGWEVDDLKITLIEGEDHEAHTKSNDFAIATPMGIMDGLQKAEMQLLEPILEFKLSAPEERLGSIISELLKLRAQFENPTVDKGKCILIGTIPVATSLDFPIKLSSLTSGKGKYIARFSSYQLCENSLGKTREYRGISPLDTAKYILKARKALI